LARRENPAAIETILTGTISPLIGSRKEGLMDLSVVIPCFNAAEHIGGQLTALSRQACDFEWEVIVADNGSSDATIELVERYRQILPALKIVDASARRGSGYARNLGARHATGDFLVFVDADDEVELGYLEAIRTALREHDFVASRFEIDKLNAHLIGAKLRNPQDRGLQKIAYPPYLAHAGGSGLGIKHEIHDRVGGFDESLPRLQDTDYCFRVQILGIELHFVAAAVVHVRYSTKPAALFRQARLWAEYNELMYRRYGRGVRMIHPWLGYVQTWRDLIRCVPRVLQKETRAGWMKTLGTQIGLLQGAIRFRVPPVH
jgi:glycosyltransferase involved in cell wall biosynthesis